MDSLQIAVAAYIAEYGSIDADTFQALTDLYTTEISDETVRNARAKRIRNEIDAPVGSDERATAETKSEFTAFLSAKRYVNQLLPICETIKNIKPLTSKSSNADVNAAHNAMNKLYALCNQIVSDKAKISNRV